jgi:hypothetical protein
MALDEYWRRRGDLERRRQQLEEQARQLEAQADRQKELAGLSDSIGEFCRRVRHGLDQASFEQRRSLIELLVDQVIVADGEVEIRYVVPTDRASEQVRFCHLRLVYLDPVVQTPPASMLHEPPQPALPLHLAERAGVALQPIGHGGARMAGVLSTERLTEEALGRPLVPLGAEQEVDGLAGAVDRPVQVAPLTVDPDEGLVDVPRAAARPQVTTHALLELRREALDPAVERDVVDLDATVGEHGLEVAVADREPEVPAHGPQDQCHAPCSPRSCAGSTACEARPWRRPDRSGPWSGQRRGEGHAPKVGRTRRKPPGRPAARSRIAHADRGRSFGGSSVDAQPFEEHRRTEIGGYLGDVGKVIRRIPRN